mmetsp:Transcript_6626/g.16508  ORF Transcript_6626/g.16508 Transcript_6626/m.16508 type:complete len:103 (+) Transcript_6626:83-391(+)
MAMAINSGTVVDQRQRANEEAAGAAAAGAVVGVTLGASMAALHEVLNKGMAGVRGLGVACRGPAIVLGGGVAAFQLYMCGPGNRIYFGPWQDTLGRLLTGTW